MSPRTSAPTEAIEAFTDAFKAVNAALRRMRGRQTTRPGELSYAQYGLLFGLRDGGSRSLRELALAADVSPGTAAEMLDSLTAAGLGGGGRATDDKRVVLTSLTERGQALVDERSARFEPRWHAALERFGDEELLIAAAVLGQVRTLFDEIAEEGAA
jgi:DNA-binding MarR family transcriptional regulator